MTTLERTCVIAEQLVRNYGMERACRRIRAADVAVLELEVPGSAARTRILDECRRAPAEDRSGTIVLGRAGMADQCADLSRELGVPVVDGVAAAVKLAETLVALGFATSKVGDLAYPLQKTGGLRAATDAALSASPGGAEWQPRHLLKLHRRTRGGSRPPRA